MLTMNVGYQKDPGPGGSQPVGERSHNHGGRLPLLSARLAVTFLALERHRPLAGTKLYCFVTDARRCKRLTPSRYAATRRPAVVSALSHHAAPRQQYTKWCVLDLDRNHRETVVYNASMYRSGLGIFNISLLSVPSATILCGCRLLRKITKHTKRGVTWRIGLKGANIETRKYLRLP